MMTNEEAMKLGARCDICPLKGVPLVPPDAPTAPLQLVIVGDNPSRKDVESGHPFVGASGKMLDTLLRKIKIPRGACHVTNAALCRGESDKENEKAAECCAPRLLSELLPLRGTPVATLGKAPTKSLLGYGNLHNARGFVWRAPEVDEKIIRAAHKLAMRASPDRKAHLELRAETLQGRARIAGAQVFPTLHPSFVLRADTWQPAIQIDFDRIGRMVRGGIAIDDKGTHTTVSTLRRLAPELHRLGPTVSIDIETDGVNPMVCKMLCVGLSDGDNTVVLWPWRRGFAGPLRKFLRTRKQVVAHNGFSFDQIVLAQHGVV